MATTYEYIVKLRDNMTRSMQKMGISGSRTYNKLQRSQEKLNQSMGKYTGMITRVLTVGAVVHYGNKAAQAWEKQAAAVRNVEAGLQSTGMVAGRTLQQLTEAATNMQKKTFFGDEAILQGVTSQMLTFTNITGVAFDKSQQAALDVTAKLYGLKASEESLKSTSIMLGKALNDPVANLGALSRSGIQFSDEQKEVIKTMAKSGRLAEAQTLILEELNKQYGGTAEALANTDGGNYIRTMNRIGDTWERIGKKIAPLRLQIANFVDKTLSKLVDIWEKWNKQIKIFLGIIAGLWAIVKIYKTWIALQTALNVVMSANPIALVVLAVAGLVAAIVYAWNKFAGFRGAVKGVWASMVELARFMKDVFITLFKETIAVVTKTADVLKYVAQGEWAKAKDAGRLALENLYHKNTIKLYMNAGKRIANAFNKAYDNEMEKANDPVKAKKDFLEKVGMNTATPTTPNVPGFSPTNGNSQTATEINEKLTGTSTRIAGGGSRPTNITINLGKLQDYIQINANSVKEGVTDMQREVEKALLRALNSANAVQ